MFLSSQIVKDDINFRLTGLASSVLREKMIVSILSDKFPSPQHCNMYRPEPEGDTDGEKRGEGDAVTTFKQGCILKLTFLVYNYI